LRRGTEQQEGAEPFVASGRFAFPGGLGRELVNRHVYHESAAGDRHVSTRSNV
jgi:hypothetical protein